MPAWECHGDPCGEHGLFLATGNSVRTVTGFLVFILQRHDGGEKKDMAKRETSVAQLSR